MRTHHVIFAGMGCFPRLSVARNWSLGVRDQSFLANSMGVYSTQTYFTYRDLRQHQYQGHQVRLFETVPGYSRTLTPCSCAVFVD